MIYYFDPKQNPEFAYLNSETMEEHEVLSKQLYVYRDKMKSIFFVKFQYLVELSRVVTLKPQYPKDKDHLKGLFDKIKALDAICQQKTYDGYDYNKHLNPDSEIQLKTFQQWGCDFIYQVKSCILADDVGLGKTIQSVLALCRLSTDGFIKNSIMIVAPASIKYQWKNEIRKYVNPKTNPELDDIEIIEGSKEDRLECYNKKAKIYIVNYELFINDFDKLMKFSRTMDAIIVDEASKIKTPSAQRTRKLNVLMGNTPIKMLLTATPIENKLLDLYSLCHFIDKSIYISYAHFEKTYCRFMKFQLGRTGVWIKKLVGYQNLGDAKLKIAGRYLRRTVDMVGEQMPKFIIQLRTVDLLPEQRKLYDKIKDDDYEFRIAQIHDLHSACNAPEILGSDIIAKSAKINELLDLLENELSSEKVIIFSYYKRFTDVIVQKLKKYNPLYIHGGVTPQDREKFKQMFNKMEKYRAMVMTSAGEYGIDFPSASVVINMDLPDNPSRLKQRCGRVRRLSSKFKNVRIINIFAKDTIETKTVERIFKKMALFERFFEEDTPDMVAGGSWYTKLTDSQLKTLF
jgi:SNF2 family DNA or RNA helicase